MQLPGLKWTEAGKAKRTMIYDQRYHVPIHRQPKKRCLAVAVQGRTDESVCSMRQVFCHVSQVFSPLASVPANGPYISSSQQYSLTVDGNNLGCDSCDRCPNREDDSMFR